MHQWIIPPSCTVSGTEYIVVSVIALLLTAVSKGGFGGGVGALSVPLMLHVAPSSGFVVGMWLPMLVVCDACTTRHYPKVWNPRSFWMLSPGMIVGILIATMYIKYAGTSDSPLFDTVLKVSVALISLVFLFLQVYRPTNAGSVAWTPTWRVALPMGLVAGLTTMIAHAAGPIITMFLLPQKLEPREYMGTCGRFFLFYNVLKLPFNYDNGLMTLETLSYGLWLMLLAPIGVWIGACLCKRLSEKWFVKIVRFSLLVAVCKLLFDALL